MSRLRALHSLWQRRVAAFSIQVGTNIQKRAVSRTITLFAVRIPMLHFQPLMLFQCHRAVHIAITSALE